MKIQRVMIWVLWFLALGNAFAQPLPPGTYHDLNPTRPLVLQKGAYVFINLTMKQLGKGIWLDGRKATQLTVLNSTFEGDGTGIGIATQNVATIQGCVFKKLETGIKADVPKKVATTQSRTGNTFTGLDYGMLVPAGTANTTTPYSIRGNTFDGNKHGVFLGSGNFNLDLRCNLFEQTTTIPTGNTNVGLVIGENASLEGNRIGGNNNTLPGSPNANVWPTATPRSTPRVILPNGLEADLHDPGVGWEDAPNWISIENLSNNVVSYFRYENEFVKNNFPQPNPNNVLYPAGSKKIITGLSNPDPSVYELACENFDDPLVILFPARFAVVTDLVGKMVDHEVYLSDPIPNPAQMETRIEVNLPVKVENALLQMLEIGSGRVLQNIVLKELGQQEVIFDLARVPSGVYSYRLLLDGIPSGTKKMVVLK